MIHKTGFVIYAFLIVIVMYCEYNGNGDIIVEHASGEYEIGDMIESSVKIENEGNREKNLYLQYDLCSESGEIVDSKMDSFAVAPKEELLCSVTISVNETVVTGRYDTKITIWDKDPKDETAVVLKESRSENKLIIYQNTEEFYFFDDSKWSISEKYLGHTRLEKENVIVQDGNLILRLPGGELSGGEIQSVGDFNYGIYEVRMKLPEADSGITGVFLYAPPDFYYEIDMELYNDSSGMLLLTTYADGKVSNTKEYELGFDPTESFHNYCFEYRKEGVLFYVDGVLVHSFSDHLPVGSMKLMINCWYPDWRGMAWVQEDQELLVDWIRY